jgi:hypothetical protein
MDNQTYRRQQNAIMRRAMVRDIRRSNAKKRRKAESAAVHATSIAIIALTLFAVAIAVLGA